jgi:hypothetical protein
MSCGIQCTWVVPCVSLPQLSGKQHISSQFNKRNSVTEFFYRYERPAGLFITVYVYIVYLVALRFEGSVFFFSFSFLNCILKKRTRPFTDMIYSHAQKAKTL